jgi:hypothetical protein
MLAALLAAPAFAKGHIANPDLLTQIKPGTTTIKQVEQLLGPPANISHFPRKNQSSMDYMMKVWDDWFDIGVMYGDDGIVREVLQIKRWKGGGA